MVGDRPAQLVPAHLQVGGAELQVATGAETHRTGQLQGPARAAVAATLQQHGSAAAGEGKTVAGQAEAASGVLQADLQAGALASDRQGAADAAQAGDSDAGRADAQFLLLGGTQVHGHGTGATADAAVDGTAGGVDAQLARGAEAHTAEALQTNAATGHQGIARLRAGAALQHQPQGGAGDRGAGSAAADAAAHARGAELDRPICTAPKGDSTADAAEARQVQADVAAIQQQVADAVKAGAQAARQLQTGHTAEHGRAAERAAATAVGADRQRAADVAEAHKGPAGLQAQAGPLGFNHPGAVVGAADGEGAPQHRIAQLQPAAGHHLLGHGGGVEAEAAAIDQADLAGAAAPVDDGVAARTQGTAAGQAAVEGQAGGLESIWPVARQVEAAQAPLAGQPAAGAGGAATGQPLGVEHQHALGQVQSQGGAAGAQAAAQVAAADHQLVNADVAAIAEQHRRVGAALDEQVAAQAEHIGNRGAAPAAEALFAGQQVHGIPAARGEHLGAQGAAPVADAQPHVAEGQVQAADTGEVDAALALQGPLAAGLAVGVGAALQQQSAPTMGKSGA